MALTRLRSSLKIILWLAPLLYIESIYSCKKENIQPLNLISIDANRVDLNVRSTRVAVKAPLTATFTTNIDPMSVSDTSILLTRDYDHAGVPLTLIISGTVVSIKPTADLISGAFYTLAITSKVKSTHGDAFGSFTITFKTAGVFVPANQVAYWNFENTPPDDLVGTYDPLSADVVDITYPPSKNDSSGRAASFNGTTSLIQIARGATLLKPEFTISFWMKLNSDNHVDGNGKPKGSFVIGIGNFHGLQFEVEPGYAWCRFSQGFLLGDLKSTTTNDFRFSANGATKDNIRLSPDPLIAGGVENATVLNQNFGSAGLKQRLNNVWAHIVMTFTDTTKTRTLYINGEKMYQQNLNLLGNSNVNPTLQPLATVKSLTFVPDTVIPAGYDDKLVFGFWQSRESTFGADKGTIYFNKGANHFQGLLDDVRIFNRSLSETEVSLIYEGEKPN
jgi:hypothetical protein